MATDALQKLSINNAPVEYVKTAINLGFTFNQTLTWDDHIKQPQNPTHVICTPITHTPLGWEKDKTKQDI